MKGKTSKMPITAKAPPTMHYFMDIVRILREMKKEDLGERSILIGSPDKIIETLKTVEAAGIGPQDIDLAQVFPGHAYRPIAAALTERSRPSS